MTSTTESPNDGLKMFRDLHNKSEFVFVVFYRGLWCPFCQAYIKKLATLRPSILAAGGETLIISSSNSDHIPAFRDLTGYDGPAVSDVDLTLVTSLRETYSIDVAITPKAGYPNGLIQPALLVVKRDGEVLEIWAIQPSIMNLGGAKDRPELDQVWENVEAKLQGANAKRLGYDKQGLLSGFFQLIWGKPTSKA